MAPEALAGCHSLDIVPLASSFLVNTAIVEGKGSFYKLRAAAYVVTVVQDILAWEGGLLVDLDSSFDLLVVLLGLTRVAEEVDLVPQQLLVENDYLKASAALANFVLKKERKTNVRANEKFILIQKFSDRALQNCLRLRFVD